VTSKYVGLKDFKYDYGNTRHLFISPWTSCLLLPLFNERIYLTQMQIYHKALYLSSFIYISARVVSRWIPFLKKNSILNNKNKIYLIFLFKKTMRGFHGFRTHVWQVYINYDCATLLATYIKHKSRSSVGHPTKSRSNAWYIVIGAPINRCTSWPMGGIGFKTKFKVQLFKRRWWSRTNP